MGHICCICGRDLRYIGNEIFECEGCRRTYWKPDIPLSEMLKDMDVQGKSYWRQ